jgi:Ni,Fe-hydrogenase maturation factor
MARTLVIGFGNLDRADDGAAFHIVNRLREGLGLSTLDEGAIDLSVAGAKFFRQAHRSVRGVGPRPLL